MISPAVMPSFIFTGNTSESMEGGMLMKSKHIATYGEKTTFSGCYSGRYYDTIPHKSTIAALATGQLL